MTTILFIHGTRLTGAQWHLQEAALADRFQTIAIDLPGHGTRADDAFTLDRAVDVVAATMAGQAREGRAVLVGLSLGGYVAMAVAARLPTLVRGLVLSGATIEPVGVMGTACRGLAAMLDLSDGEPVTRASRWFFEHRFPPAIADPIIAGGFWPRGGAEALRAVAGERFLPRLAAYPGPTLFLNGDLDFPFRAGAPAFAAAARRPTRVRLARASHLSNLDAPDAYSHAVLRFTERLPGE